ncbi:MAG TPA: hypothetical protein VL360_05220 [Gammaproteobacteria bacterium]|nr:hypothetical protein [Gammaproteobacteria bacterium]
MIVIRDSMAGVTLLEVMLVLVIGSAILAVGMNQYQAMRRDSDVNAAMYNVDQIFQAAADFYQANCRIQISPATGQVNGTGKLDPRYIASDGTPATPPNPYPITITELRTDGFLNVTLPVNPIIASTGVNGGYMVQFNMVTPPPDRTLVTSSGTTIKLGQIIMWRTQVAIQLNDQTKANTYMNAMGADCISILGADGQTVTPCRELGAVPVGATLYLVWERLPSFAVPASNSNLWMTNARVKGFTQQYDTTNSTSLGNVPAGSYPAQYYLCGS